MEHNSRGSPSSVTLPAALIAVLSCLAFLAGRFYQQSALLPSASVAEQVLVQNRRQLRSETVKEIKRAGRNVKMTAATGKEIALPQHTPRIDPLNPVELEHLFVEASGLLKLTPPLKAAPSGDDFYHAIPFQILSWYPRVVLFPAFVDKARCEVFISIASKYLHPSGLAYKPGDAIPDSQQTRTSTGTFISSSMDPDGALAWVEEKIAAATLVPRSNGEAFNVLHYENGQHYDSHYDTFDPKDFGPQPNQRIATIVIYLSDVEEGGETVFKREGAGNGDKAIQDWRNCDDGSFKYAPRQGDAVLFWDIRPSGDIDPHALHGACPVKKGQKWSAAKWLHARG